ncbi:MAG: hypothetical protein QOF45_726 [Gaiellaceae bacterium]|jgi:hypothetical protein|nr:hypothetical protein [Gaiellaceae bacterium]
MLARAEVLLDNRLELGVKEKPRASPSMIEANREIPAAARTPALVATRRASAIAATRSSRLIR